MAQDIIARQRLRLSAEKLQPKGPKNIYLHVTGQVQSGSFRGEEPLACTYDFSYGPDWRIQEGPALATNDSQYSINDHSRKSGATVVWNFPIAATFSTTNAYGWPRLVLTVQDNKKGNCVGYGAVLLPTRAGKYTRYVHMFAPIASSPLQEFLGWLLSAPAEFRDTKFAARNNDREVTRVKSHGIVKVTLNVTTKNMEHFGYTESITLNTKN